MFETARVRAADRHFGTLAVSFLMHVMVVAAVIAASLSTTRLPVEPPKEIMPIVIVPEIPLAAGTQTPLPKPKSAPAPKHDAAVTPPAPLTAPQTIPTTVEPVAAVASAAAPAGATTEANGPGVPNGVPNGVPVDAGQTVAPDAAGPIRIVAGVKAPVVLRRVEPLYPLVALRAHMGGWVIVECVIDKSGHIRDARVVQSSFSAFEQPAIDAVQQWLFAPGSLNGQLVDTIFDLKVIFQVK